MSSVQIIDQGKVFNEDELMRIVKDSPYKYLRVIAILGPQSSGKSTLLNGVFGTVFDVMNDTNRKQTTRGIWACLQKNSDVLVMDVEGTDGRERGEDQDFERKSALFALAVSQVLIMNIWENSVGLYHAANMSLLRTVIDVHLQLKDISRKDKTIILFVIRDYAGKTPKANLSQVLLDDMMHIWNSVSRPDSNSNCSLEESFDIRFAFLPHKILQTDLFDEKVLELRERFFDQHHDDFLFSDGKELFNPADFPIFASNIWEKIDSNKELDLPTERELLAQYRCEEIAEQILSEFSCCLNDIRQKLCNGNIDDEFGRKINHLLSSAKGKFITETDRYPNNTVSKKLDELNSKLYDHSASLLSTNFSNFTKISLDAFEKSMRSSGRTAPLMEGLRESRKILISELESFLLDCIPVSIPGISSDKYYSEFTELLNAKINLFKLEELSGLFEKCRRKTEKALHTLSHLSFGLGRDGDFWICFWNLIFQCENAVSDCLEFSDENFEVTDSRVSKVRADFINWYLDEILTTFKQEFSDQRILDRLNFLFENLFLYDEAKLPRIWKSETEVDLVFTAVRERVFDQLEKMRNVDIPDEIQNSLISKVLSGTSIAILDTNQAKNLKSSLDKFFERRFLEAKRSTVSSLNHIPPWVFLVLLVLGWNELMTVLSSPLYLLLAFLGMGIFIVIKALNLTPYIWGALDLSLSTIRKYAATANDLPPQNNNKSASNDRAKID